MEAGCDDEVIVASAGGARVATLGVAIAHLFRRVDPARGVTTEEAALKSRSLRRFAGGVPAPGRSNDRLGRADRDVQLAERLDTSAPGAAGLLLNGSAQEALSRRLVPLRDHELRPTSVPPRAPSHRADTAGVHPDDRPAGVAALADLLDSIVTACSPPRRRNAVREEAVALLNAAVNGSNAGARPGGSTARTGRARRGDTARAGAPRQELRKR
jgi:hypothetical protein